MSCRPPTRPDPLRQVPPQVDGARLTHIPDPAAAPPLRLAFELPLSALGIAGPAHLAEVAVGVALQGGGRQTGPPPPKILYPGAPPPLRRASVAPLYPIVAPPPPP